MNMVWFGCSGSQVASSRSDVVDVFSVDISLVLMERLKLVLVFLEGLLLLNEQSVIEVDDIGCHTQALVVMLLICEEFVYVFPLVYGVSEAILQQLVLLPGVVKFRILKFEVVLATFLIHPRVAEGLVRHGIEILVLFFLYLSFKCVFEVVFEVVNPIILLSI